MSDLLSLGAAAKILGITPRTLTTWERAGKITVVHFGRKTHRVERAELDRLIASCRKPVVDFKMAAAGERD
jgi:excisionase family DNA binding protein